MRWTARALNVIGATLPAVALSISLVVPSANADPILPEDWTQEDIDARYELYRQRVNQLYEQGSTDAEVDVVVAAEFAIFSLTPNTDFSPKAALLGEVEFQSASSDVVMYTPKFGYDSLLRKYVMSASWAWKSTACSSKPCWLNDRSSSGNVGGPDGMALKINRATTRSSVGISTSDNCGKPALSNNQPDTANSYGVGFIEQDAVSYGGGSLCTGTAYRYNWHRGTISEAFTFNSNCAGAMIVVDSRIGHTWSTTSVTSISISTTGIGFGWSTTEHRWNAQPSSPATGYC